MGMGDERWFMIPAKLVKPEEVPDPWGLLEISEAGYARATKAAQQAKVNKNAEVTMLVSVLRRLELSTAVFVRQEI